MPLSVETPAPVSTTQGRAERNHAPGASRSANTGQQLPEREVLERVNDQVGLREIEPGRHVVREGDAEDSRRTGGGDAVRGVLDRDCLVCRNAEAIEGLEVESRARLEAFRISVCTDHARPLLQCESPKVVVDPRPRAARHDRNLQAEPSCVVEILANARAQGLELEQLELPPVAGRPDGVTVAGSREQGVELVELVELVRAGERADPKCEAIERNPEAVRIEDLPPRPQADRFRVDECPVEVEEKRSDHATIVE